MPATVTLGTVTPADASVTWMATAGSTTISGNGTTAITVPAPTTLGLTHYTVTATIVTGAKVCSVTGTADVTVNPTPTLNLTAQVYCQGSVPANVIIGNVSAGASWTVMVGSSVIASGSSTDVVVPGPKAIGTTHFTVIATLGGCSIQKEIDVTVTACTPQLKLVKSADKSFVLPGGVVVYTYVVTNIGEVVLDSVTVVDDNGTPGDPSDDVAVGYISSLAPGASQTFTMSTTLPQEMCMVINGQNLAVGTLYITDLGDSIQVKYVQKTVNDNRYGTGATVAAGWNRSHSFNDLLGSDKAEFRFTDGNGNVVLDFFVDYITSSSAFPSGYGSLGVSGGDGSWVSGTRAYLLGATTSLSDTLNTATFKTGYTVNSPPETAPASGISVPAGWDYDNSYTVVVSKAAFGTSGFGGVSIPAIHDSPPKVGANLVTPSPCDSCIVNVAVATGSYGTETVTASDTAQVCIGTPPPPKLNIVKTADRPTIPVDGGDVTYTYVVQNIGGQTITDITVVDDNGTPDDSSDDVVVGTIASLDPLQSVTLTKTFFVAPLTAPVSMCMNINGVSTTVGRLYITDLGDRVQVKYVQVGVNDNRYGTGATAATGWSRAQSFNNLLGSDKAEFRFSDANGAVVLDFFVDYISSSSSFPSGYGSLGITGGDGSWVSGNKAYLLSATTSLSDSLNTAAFKSGFNVNSPPETAPLSGVSVPPGWDYDNSYTVVVSKAAFGAAGFGGVSIPAVHDSPPKIGSSNLVTPSPCDLCVVNVVVASGRAGTITVTAQDTAQVCVESDVPHCPSTSSSIGSGFNATSISAANYLWFTANFSAKGIPATGATLTFKNSQITINSSKGVFTYATPDGKITFSPSATCASTTFDGTQWVTTVPLAGSDEILLSALGIKAPADVKSAKVTWTADFSSDVAGLTMSWKWSAAVYTTDMTAPNYNSLGVKPTHASACGYANSDHAGTPEVVKKSVVGGARGGGGSNFTGSWSSTAKPVLCQ